MWGSVEVGMWDSVEVGVRGCGGGDVRVVGGKM